MTKSVLIFPIKDMTDKTISKDSKKCPAIKTTANSLKQKINNKRNDVPISANKVIKSFSKANFIAHWVQKDLLT